MQYADCVCVCMCIWSALLAYWSVGALAYALWKYFSHFFRICLFALTFAWHRHFCLFSFLSPFLYFVYLRIAIIAHFYSNIHSCDRVWYLRHFSTSFALSFHNAAMFNFAELQNAHSTQFSSFFDSSPQSLPHIFYVTIFPLLITHYHLLFVRTS